MRTTFSPVRPTRRRVVALFAALSVTFASSRAEAQRQAGETLRVRLDVAPGPYLVGQGIELRLAVVGRDERPKLELPDLPEARLWIIDTSFKPISVSGIGPSISGENVFRTRLRLVPRVAGLLDVPPIVARLDGDQGRSKPLHLKIENPPMAGRTSNFLGGVGEFTAEAEAEASRTRVGQAFLFRIRVSGPGAWGMATRPDLGRLRALPIEARVEPLADETVDEPPQRTFVFRVRPTRPGDVVLPPVSIASYDPKLKLYITRATRGVPLQVVAVPDFDASTIDYRPAPEGLARRAWIVTIALFAAAGLAAVVVLVARRGRRRWIEAARSGPIAARRFARGVALKLGSTSQESQPETARRVIEALIEYARLGVGRAPGALTPDEARAAIAGGSGSDELGRGAARLTARCDRILFAEGDGREAGSLTQEARELFTALGRSGGWRRSLASISEPRNAPTSA